MGGPAAHLLSLQAVLNYHAYTAIWHLRFMYILYIYIYTNSVSEKPRRDGLQSTSDGLQPRRVASNLEEMASNLEGMASNLEEMACNLLAMASSLEGMA